MRTAKRSNKYSAQRTTLDGIPFDSRREAKRWAELCLLEHAGEIADLRRQVPLMLEGRDGPLLTRTGRRMRLTVDFAYTDLRTGLTVFEDAKGVPTRDYEVRRAVAAAQGMEIREV
ncbi:MAG TPA: DUF1064 domain-containing protein [Thiotrichales bacterium]|nr:DUF1064 domain-containing protein [Thiotrichales bacterium]